MDVRGRGRPDQRGKLPRLLSEDECILFLVPVDERAANCRRPFQLEVWCESSLNLQRLLCLNVEQHYRTRFVNGNEQCLAHSKRVSRVKNTGGLRAHGESPRQAFRRQRPAANVECEMKLAEDLERIDPCSHPSSVVA